MGSDTMIICKTKKWGNSLGLIIPSEDVEKLDLVENQRIVVEIVKAQNPLQELFGFGKGNKITRVEFKEARALLESTRF